MVRNLSPSPLTLSVLSAAGEPIVQLRVDTVEHWTLENVTVLSTPDGSLTGAPFPHLNAAMGQLKHFLPRQVEAHEYLELLHVYVVGPLDETLLGAISIRFKLYGESVATRHSPALSTAPVRCFATEEVDKGGRWLPVSILRPFVPRHVHDDEAARTVDALMRAGKHVPFVNAAFRTGTKRPLPPGFQTASDVSERRGGDGADGRGDARQGEGDGAPGDGDGDPGAPGAPADMKPSASGKRSGRQRDKWFDKKGNVVVPRQEGAMALEYWPACLVITGKQHGPPVGASKSPRYVVTAEPLPPAQGSPKDTWHISEVEPLRDALPRAWRMLRDGEYGRQGGRERMREAMKHAVWAQNKAPFAAQSVEETWDGLVPEARGCWRAFLES